MSKKQEPTIQCPGVPPTRRAPSALLYGASAAVFVARNPYRKAVYAKEHAATRTHYLDVARAALAAYLAWLRATNKQAGRKAIA